MCLRFRSQLRVAGILSAYDELIENNQRRIQILETMARALYREWFVEFRFPGHDKIPRVASPLGDIPQGWEIVAFTEIVDVLGGGTPKTAVAEYWNGRNSILHAARCSRLLLRPRHRQAHH